MNFNESAEKQTEYSYVRKIIAEALNQGGGHGIAAGGNNVQEWTNILSMAARDSGADFIKMSGSSAYDDLDLFFSKHMDLIRNANGQPLVIAVDASDNELTAAKYSEQAIMQLSNMIGRVLDNSENVVYVQMSEEGAGQFLLNTHRTHKPVSLDKPQP